MRLGILIILSVAAVLAAANELAEEKECNCVPLQKCRYLLSNLRTAHRRSRKNHWKYTRYLTKLHCGFNGLEPLVCCPVRCVSEDYTDDDTDSSEGIQIIQPRKLKCSFAPLDELPKPTTKRPDYSKDPKLEKLFTDCGKGLRINYLFGNKTDYGDYPWLALLNYETPNGKQTLCGGVLIGDQHILTAAHCVTSPSNRLISVRLGEHDTSTEIDCTRDGSADDEKFCADAPIEAEVERIIVHEGYNNGISHRDGYDDDDLALIKLKAPVAETPYVKPICLPQYRDVPRKFFVAGWGRSLIPQARGLEQKYQSRLTIVKSDRCTEHYALQFVDERLICAGDPHKDSLRERPCVADAGGALMNYEVKERDGPKMTVFGVSYMDLECGKLQLPGVFTRVHDYVPWIVERIYSE